MTELRHEAFLRDQNFPLTAQDMERKFKDEPGEASYLANPLRSGDDQYNKEHLLLGTYEGILSELRKRE